MSDVKRTCGVGDSRKNRKIVATSVRKKVEVEEVERKKGKAPLPPSKQSPRSVPVSRPPPPSTPPPPPPTEKKLPAKENNNIQKEELNSQRENQQIKQEIKETKNNQNKLEEENIINQKEEKFQDIIKFLENPCITLEELQNLQTIIDQIIIHKNLEKLQENISQLENLFLDFKGTKMEDAYFTIDEKLKDFYSEIDDMKGIKTEKTKMKKREILRKLNSYSDKYDDIINNAPSAIDVNERERKMEEIGKVREKLEEIKNGGLSNEEFGEKLYEIFNEANLIDDLMDYDIEESKEDLIKEIQRLMIDQTRIETKKNEYEADLNKHSIQI